MKANNLFERLANLIREGEPNHNLAEQLDRELIQASQHAENKCRQRPITYRSIDLHQHKEKLSVYGQLWRRLKKGLTISALQASANERGIAVHQNPTLHQLDQEIKTLRTKVKACHKESAEKRQEYLQNQANIANDNEEHARATALK